MSVTLNILAYELEQLGHTVRICEENHPFDGVRLFLQNKPVSPNMLYICNSPDSAAMVSASGGLALLAGPLAAAAESPSAGKAAQAPETTYAKLLVLDNASYLEVFDELLDIFNRYETWQKSMERIRHTGGTLQELVDISEPFLKNNVVILDPALKLIAYTKGVPCDDPITSELIEHGYHTEDNIRKFKLHKRFKPWSEDDGFVINESHEICKYVTVVKSFKANASFSLISVMMCNVVNPDAHVLDIFDLFTAEVEFYAQRDYPAGKPSGNAIDSLLRDLISDDLRDEGAIEERCRCVGLPYEGTFCLFYMKPEENSAPLMRLLADTALSIAPAKAFVVGDAAVVLCFNCAPAPCNQDCNVQACPHHSRKTVTERLDSLAAGHDLVCGRSSKFSKLSHIACAYAQAREAHDFGRKALSHGHSLDAPEGIRRVFSFDRFVTDYLVGQLSDEQIQLVTSTHAGRIVASLAETDSHANTDNYEFLKAYLLNERRTSAVAELLHMHRNNVTYRIKRIEEQFDINTEDPMLRADLIAAFRFRDAFIVQNAQ